MVFLWQCQFKNSTVMPGCLSKLMLTSSFSTKKSENNQEICMILHNNWEVGVHTGTMHEFSIFANNIITHIMPRLYIIET